MMRSGKRKLAVTVVGCGVSGLTSGIRLLEAQFDITIVARDLPPNTTSSVAAAIWYPYKAYPEDRVLAWGRVAFEEFYHLATVSGSGVSIIKMVEVFREPVADPWWRSAVRQFSRTPAADLPPGYRDGYTVEVPLIETPIYLRYLLERFRQAGGRIEQRTVVSLTDLVGENRLIVNCSGLGAREVCQDTELYPIRGQILRVRAPAAVGCLIDDTDPDAPTYIVPRRDGCVLGGTAVAGDWNLNVDPASAARIQQRCVELQPCLHRADILEQRVGLRPGRKEIRLEFEMVLNRCGVIHNYGHGGAGFTLSWGCADEVTDLAMKWT